MKIALCLSGQPRNAIQTSFRIKQSIIENNDVDVFLHAWYDSNNLNFDKRCPGHWNRSAEPDIDKKLIEIYQPKAYIFEKPKHWSNPNIKVSEDNIKRFFDYGLKDPGGTETFGRYIVDICHSQWYSNSRVNFLKEQYSIENEIKYDCVIKLRYDVSPNVKINFNNVQFDDSVLYYQQLNQPLNMVSDWFTMGSNKVMNVWSSLYYFIEPLCNQVISKENAWCNELLVRDHLINNNVTAQPIDLKITF
jgi:hypothetical protein